MLGAHKVSELLRQRGIEFEVIVDEGGTILSDGIKPITSRLQPVAVVGTSERVRSHPGVGRGGGKLGGSGEAEREVRVC